MSTRACSVEVESVGAVEVSVDERGTGAPVLMLHGGGGPQTVSTFAELLARQKSVRVLTPTHPGFGGTARPERLSSIRGLAAVYARLIETLELDDVTVIGNSIGGWIAAELALLGAARLRRLFLVDAVGIAVEGHPVLDVFAIAPEELSRHSFHDPARFRIDLASMSEAQRKVMAGNRAALATYGGSMSDASLLGRLGQLALPTTVIWGESDRVVDPEYGQRYAAAIPAARFVTLKQTGHLPQIESPDALLAALD